METRKWSKAGSRVTGRHSVKDDGPQTGAVLIANTHPLPRLATGWACAENGVDPDVFDPTDPATLREALSWCAACPLREQCFEIGSSTRGWGVWGGVLLENGKPAGVAQKVRYPCRASIGLLEKEIVNDGLELGSRSDVATRGALEGPRHRIRTKLGFQGLAELCLCDPESRGQVHRRCGG